MERKGGCLLVPRYGPGSGVGGQAPGQGVSWQMGKIMLKFRPIAPKPAAMAPAPAPTPVLAAAAASGRGKRKAASGGGGGGKRGRKSKKATTGAAVAPATAAAVQAVPVGEKEKEREKEKSLSTSRSSSSSAMTSVDSSSPPSPPTPPPSQAQQPPATLPLMPVSPSSEKAEEPAPLLLASAPVAPRPTAPVASSVTVEDVTSTWRDGEAPSAASACVGADGDEAPAFVSDRWGRITWANAAFTRAVVSSDDAAGSVALAGALPAWGSCAGFTCRTRVRHHRRGGSVVAPCDVWRLDADGCYLWRLDLQAALTLGAGLP